MERVKFIAFVLLTVSVLREIKCQTSQSTLIVPPANDTNFWRRVIDPRASAYQITSTYVDTCSTRQAPGYVCMSDCKTLARCVYRQNEWATIPIQVCDSEQGLFCHAQEQSCSRNRGPCNPGNGGGGGGGPGGGAGGNFPCSSEGVFPDPHNCQMYHMCFMSFPNLIAVNIRCGGNFAFNPITGDCSLTTVHQVCQQPQFRCTNPGDMGAWPLNPNIYFICMAETTEGANLILFPSLFRCPVGEIFRNGDCVRGSGPGLPPGGGPPGNFPPGGGPGDGNNFNCQRAGLFPDPFDCRSYFHCNGLLRSRHLTCPSGTYFNPLTLGCIRGTC